MDKKLDILAIGAHPDDVELGCGGTIYKEICKGKSVGILDLTRGELGTRGTPEMRANEAKNAANILNVKTREQLDLGDVFFEYNKKNLLKIVDVIHTYRPDIILCNAIEDRHIDHGKGSKLVSDACFISGLTKINRSKNAWRPKAVYHYIQWKYIKPDIVVDISSVIDKKIEAIMAYKSQFYDPNSTEPKTPISSKNFLESISYRSKDLGRMVGVEYAEGFTVERFAAVNYISDLF